MLDTLLIVATLATAPQPNADIAFNTLTDGIYDNKQELNKQYPGLSGFWASDAHSFFFKGSAKVTVIPGQSITGRLDATRAT